jgi:hypothetical protein
MLNAEAKGTRDDDDDEPSDDPDAVIEDHG